MKYERANKADANTDPNKFFENCSFKHLQEESKSKCLKHGFSLNFTTKLKLPMNWSLIFLRV
jgi:hypothetical protein